MTSREKALDLQHRMKDCLYSDGLADAKQCALVCVEEVIDQWEYIDTYLADDGGNLNPNLKYWLEVKQELKKL